MAENMEYIMKVAAAYALFGLFYLVFFRKDTFFKRNRVYLLLSLLLPPLLPLLSLPFALPWETTSSLPMNPDLLMMSFSENDLPVSVEPKPFDFNLFLTIFYWLGVVLVMSRAILSYISVFHLIGKAEKTSMQKLILALTQKEVAPFSIFKWLVISKEHKMHDDFDKIVRHEAIHCRQKHSLDLLLTEIVLAFQWFNPIVWWFRYAISENHEYLVDQELLKGGMDSQTYQFALLSQFQSKTYPPLVSHFNQSMLKNRIRMMNQKQSPRYYRIKEALLFPLSTGMIIAMCSFEPNSSSVPLQLEGNLMEELQLQGSHQTEEVKKETTLSSEKVIQEGKKMLYSVEKKVDDSNSYKIVKTSSADTISVLKRENDIEVIGYGKMGEKGGGVTIKGLQEENSPLYVVDGEIISKDQLADLSPDDIHSMQVLKDKKATDVYGSKGKNGVIEITTKGKAPKKTVQIEPVLQEKGTVKIKGVGGKNQPLYVVDGEVLSDDRYKDIDPNEIQSISVLKDLSATALYGEKGKNGVILIATKAKGKEPGMNIVPVEPKEAFTGAKIKKGKSKRAPLILVDGHEVSQKEMDLIQPEKIESMTILKDASARKKYGRKAKNGVVIVTTKK